MSEIMYFFTERTSVSVPEKYLAKNYSIFFFTTIQRAIYHCFSPTLIHFSLFPNNFCFTNFRFYEIIYFVIDYNYIFINLLFFFTVKLSMFSRLCVKHKRVMSRSTHTEI